MEIKAAVGAEEVPSVSVYSEIYAAALALDPGQALPVEFESEQKCRAVYEVLFNWKLRNGHDSLIVRKRGECVYIERRA